MKLPGIALLFVSVIINFYSCSAPECNCDPPINETTTSPGIKSCNLHLSKQTLSFSKSQFSSKLNMYAGICLYEKNDSIYLTYVTKEGNIIFSNLFDSTDVHEAILGYKASADHILEMKTFKDTLILVQKDDRRVIKLQINPDFTTSVLQEIDLNLIVDIKNWHIRFNNRGKQFDYQYPYLILPYGKRKGINLYDKKSHLLINTALNTVDKIIPFPSCYSSCYVQSESPSAAIRGDKIIGLFSFNDDYQEIDLNSKSTTLTSIPDSKPFIEFDKNEIRNIAYARKYDLLSEMNINACFAILFTMIKTFCNVQTIFLIQLKIYW